MASAEESDDDSLELGDDLGGLAQELETLRTLLGENYVAVSPPSASPLLGQGALGVKLCS
jgi:hypothetical protein